MLIKKPLNLRKEAFRIELELKIFFLSIFLFINNFKICHYQYIFENFYII